MHAGYKKKNNEHIRTEGLMPTMPLRPAGTRPDPAVSVPNENAARPAATATALPVQCVRRLVLACKVMLCALIDQPEMPTAAAAARDEAGVKGIWWDAIV